MAADADPDYGAMLACANNCTDLACANNCISTHPAGAQKSTALFTCTKQNCDVPCNHEQPYARIIPLAFGHGPIDWCWRTTGASSWQGPLVQGSGLTYKSPSATVRLNAGAVDFRVIDAGGTCDSPIASQDAVQVDLDTVNTVAVFGAPPSLLVLASEKPPSSYANLRLVHLAPAVGTTTVEVPPVPPLTSGATLGTMSYGQKWTGTAVSAKGFLSVAATPNPSLYGVVLRMSAPPIVSTQYLSIQQDLETTWYLLPVDGGSYEFINCDTAYCN